MYQADYIGGLSPWLQGHLSYMDWITNLVILVGSRFFNAWNYILMNEYQIKRRFSDPEIFKKVIPLMARSELRGMIGYMPIWEVFVLRPIMRYIDSIPNIIQNFPTDCHCRA
jgi:hypothetical protein